MPTGRGLKLNNKLGRDAARTGQFRAVTYSPAQEAQGDTLDLQAEIEALRTAMQ